MRRLILLLFILFVGIFALSRWQPGIEHIPPTATPSPTLLPDDFTLIPPFVPSYPCELQTIEVYDAQLCRIESIHETLLAQDNEASFIRHDYHMGMGCWGSVSQDIHELRVCQPASGATTTLTDSLVTPLLPSPDGEWYAFATMRNVGAGDDTLRPHIYRVRHDGTSMQRLDNELPLFAIGAPYDLRWLDESWLGFQLWDGFDDENSWHAYRMKADGSGEYEPLAGAE